MKLWWLSPGDPAQRTGGYLDNARMVAELRAAGQAVEVLAVDGAWPLPGVSDASLLARVPDGDPVVADGLLWPGLGAAGAALAARCPTTVLVHSLLAAETGVPPDLARRLDAAERAALRTAARVVATSDLTRRGLGFEVDVVIPGTDRAPRAAGSDGTRLLTVGTLTRRKGHDRLLDALASVEAPWTLTCAGAPRDPDWAASLVERTVDLGLADRVSFVGDLGPDAMDAVYDRADLVVQVAAYEAFGMAIAEAVARGLPVVTTDAGLLDHLPADAVVRVDHDLAGTISALLEDPGLRRAQADRARAAADHLPTWRAQAERLSSAIRGVA